MEEKQTELETEYK